MSELHQQQCSPVNKDSDTLNAQQIKDYLQQIIDWKITTQQEIQRTFTFKDYYHTIAFVNAVAWIAQQDDHHPDMQVSYKNCIVTFTTHAVNGLTINDFICAAKINKLL